MDCEKDQGYLCRVILLLIVITVEMLETETWVNNTRLQHSKELLMPRKLRNAGYVPLFLREA